MNDIANCIEMNDVELEAAQGGNPLVWLAEKAAEFLIGDMLCSFAQGAYEGTPLPPMPAAPGVPNL